MSIRTVIADDHEVVRAGLMALLQGSDVEIVGEAESAEAAVAQTAAHRPDVVLLDVCMPKPDGLTALEMIRTQFPETRVIMLSAYDNPTYVARAIALGASDYVLKGASRAELLDAIQRAVNNLEPDEGSLLRKVRKTMSRRKDRENDQIPLTNRELQVLRHVALGLSNREIGLALGISIETVKEHVQNILRKLDVNDRTQAAVWAVRRQLV